MTQFIYNNNEYKINGNTITKITSGLSTILIGEWMNSMNSSTKKYIIKIKIKRLISSDWASMAIGIIPNNIQYNANNIKGKYIGYIPNSYYYRANGDIYYNETKQGKIDGYDSGDSLKLIYDPDCSSLRCVIINKNNKLINININDVLNENKIKNKKYKWAISMLNKNDSFELISCNTITSSSSEISILNKKLDLAKKEICGLNDELKEKENEKEKEIKKLKQSILKNEFKSFKNQINQKIDEVQNEKDVK